jgi:hypothetical protein
MIVFVTVSEGAITPETDDPPVSIRFWLSTFAGCWQTSRERSAF